MNTENKETKKNNSNDNFTIIRSGYGSGSNISPNIIEIKQISRENNDFTIVCHGKDNDGFLS